MYSLFISDVHLSSDTPEIAASFLQILKQKAPEADALYLLGDVFEYWLGDDAITDAHQPFINAIREISDAGIPVYFMHGNRDFLVGEKFADLCACTLLNDPCVIDLYGTPTLLMHGDLLCTDDTDYQVFRKTVRNPDWQSQFLNMSIPERLAMAKKARDASQAQTSAHMQDAEEIMDANHETVKQYLLDAGVRQMIHGHTHRPAIHEFELNGNTAKRVVLGDWHPEPSYLMISKNEILLHDPRIPSA